MGEKEDKEKAEKLAAAKKRVAQMQKKKKAAGEKGGTSSKKTKDAAKAAGREDAEEPPTEPPKEETEAVEDLDPTSEVKGPEGVEETKQGTQGAEAAGDEDADTAAFNAAIKSANDAKDDAEEEEGDSISPPQTTASPSQESARPRHSARQPSVSLQSKLRSASFRHGATPTSPAVDDEFPDIYRKQMARIEELERENQRLAKEAQESQARWQKNEDELEGLREKAVEQPERDSAEEVQKLRSEIDTLRRNSKQSASVPKQKDEYVEHLKKEIESKEATISDMQLEISRLRSQVDALTTEGKNENEQIAALQDSLQRSETSNTKLQTELQDTKKALSRASEKAVLDGTERTSKETKIRALERELEEMRAAREASDKRAESLQMKVEAMNKLHRETEQRNGPKLAQADATAKELQMIKAKLEAVEKDNLKLREARKHGMSGEGADELAELEDEDHKKLERRIRELEGENFDLRRGIWRDKRREMQPNLSLGGDGGNADDFDEVDLNGSGATTRKSSTMHPPPPSQTRHSGFTQVLNSGLAAFRTSTASPDSQQRPQTRPRNDSLLEEFDDDAFDEHAFAAAQREEEMKKMVEHVREVKKELKKWQGWRLDLVDLRRSGGGGAGFGEMFEV